MMHETIYNQWHEFAKSRDVEGLLSLYADDAVLESPLVPIILNTTSGALIGKKNIHQFLMEGTKRRPNDLVRWYRDGRYFTKGNILIWEYPRKTPEGEQIDILELMEIENKKIIYHRIYWGWFGVQLLLKRNKV